MTPLVASNILYREIKLISAKNLEKAIIMFKHRKLNSPN